MNIAEYARIRRKFPVPIAQRRRGLSFLQFLDRSLVKDLQNRAA